MWWIRGAILGALRGAPPTSSLTGDDGLEDDLPADEHDPLEDVTRAGLREGVPELLDALPDHGRKVVTLRYGLDGNTDHSVAETARALGTSQARVRRIEEHALPLENVRAQQAYGQPSAVNRLLILNAEYQPGRGTVLLLREAIGF